jgi:hypothetical protein
MALERAVRAHATGPLIGKRIAALGALPVAHSLVDVCRGLVAVG